MDNKCTYDKEHECKGLHRVNDVSGDLKMLSKRMSEFQQSVSDTNSRFGARIGKLEARDEVRDEQYKHFREKLENITHDTAEIQRENKDSISELRREHKESMTELRRDNKKILDAVTPLSHRVETLEHLSEDVEELKEKPGETWEHIKQQGIGWIVAIVLAILAVALGLGKYI